MPQQFRLFLAAVALVVFAFSASPLRADEGLMIPQSENGGDNTAGQGLTLGDMNGAKTALTPASKDTVAWGKLSQETLAPNCDNTKNNPRKPTAYILTIPSSFCKSPSYASSDVCLNKLTEVRVEWKRQGRKLASIMAENKMVFVNGTYKENKDCWYPYATIEVTDIRRGQK